ncbi:MAG: hypothetical protein R3Y50_10600 [Rikenellaceae bacterium]
MKNSKLAILLLPLIVTITLNSCKNSDIELISVSNFETTISGKQVSLYTIKNSQGTTMQVTNFGARVVSLWNTDRNGKMDDIVIGYNNIENYIHNKGERFLGATIGRYGNRIAGGKFSLDGKQYQLSTYDNGQCLHGGDIGFDMVVWSVDSLTDRAIYFSYISKDMEEGFPRTLTVKMAYILTEQNEFKVIHNATTDKATPISSVKQLLPYS